MSALFFFGAAAFFACLVLLVRAGGRAVALLQAASVAAGCLPAAAAHALPPLLALCAAVTTRDIDPTAPLGIRRGIQTQIEARANGFLAVCVLRGGRADHLVTKAPVW